VPGSPPQSTQTYSLNKHTRPPLSTACAGEEIPKFDENPNDLKRRQVKRLLLFFQRDKIDAFG
jgi:hypothetical protein